MCIPVVWIIAGLGVFALAFVVACVIVVRMMHKAKGGPA